MKNTSNSPQGISVIIHTKNEEKNIVECIKSAKKIASEIIVVDMCSTDSTVKLAKKSRAKVYRFKDVGFADPARNFGISKTKNRWVLSLDADERIPKKLALKIQEIIKEDKFDVVLFPFKNIRLGKWMRHTGWWPDYHPRLFKKGYLKWAVNTKHAHLAPITKGRLLILDATEENAILHNNVTDMKSFFSKMMRYYFLEGSGDYFKDRKVTLSDLTNYCEGEFKWRFILEKGYLDGTHGFIFSKLREYAKFIEFINWWESEGYPEIFKQEELFKLTKEPNIPKSSKIFKLWRIFKRILYLFINLPQRLKSLLSKKYYHRNIY